MPMEFFKFLPTKQHHFLTFGYLHACICVQIGSIRIRTCVKLCAHIMFSKDMYKIIWRYLGHRYRYRSQTHELPIACFFFSWKESRQRRFDVKDSYLEFVFWSLYLLFCKHLVLGMPLNQKNIVWYPCSPTPRSSSQSSSWCFEGSSSAHSVWCCPLTSSQPCTIIRKFFIPFSLGNLVE